MAVFSGPEIAKNGIIFSLDAANRSSYSEPASINLLAENLSTATDINSRSTKTIIGSNEVRFVNNGSGASTVRFYVNNGVLVNGDTYGISVYIKDVTGTISFDWCDTTITDGVNSLSSNGRLFGLGTRSTYDSIYRFVDVNIPVNGAVTLFDAQVDSVPYVTNYKQPSGTTTQAIRRWNDLNFNRTKNNATLVNGSYFSSFGGGSMSFNGSTNYISLSRNDFNTSLPNFTISALVYKTANGIIFGNHFHGSTWESVWFSTTEFTVNGANNNTTNRQSMSFTTPNNAWMNLVAVNSSSQNYMKVFLNGAELATRTATVTPWSSSVIPTIGAQLQLSSTAIVGPLAGNISQVFVYDRALTAAEIAQNYNSFRGRFAI